MLSLSLFHQSRLGRLQPQPTGVAAYLQRWGYTLRQFAWECVWLALLYFASTYAWYLALGSGTAHASNTTHAASLVDGDPGAAWFSVEAPSSAAVVEGAAPLRADPSALTVGWTPSGDS